MLQALQAPDPIEEPAAFAVRAIELAIRMSEDKVLALDEHEETGLELPPELQRIFEMPANLRHCFVLRVLLGVGAGPCAAILGRQINEVHESTSAAILSLAGLEQHIAGGHMNFKT